MPEPIRDGGQLDLLELIPLPEPTLPPTMFGHPARSIVERLAVIDQWRTEYARRQPRSTESHLWTPTICGPKFPETGTEQCGISIWSADTRCDRWNHPDRRPCQCVGNLLYRFVCTRLGCSHQGPIRDSENHAAEDALDHQWPGWRNLPTLTQRWRYDGPNGSRRDKATQTWLQTATTDGYDPHWLLTGGPVLTVRDNHGTRHVPDVGTPWGGYDLAATNPRPTS